MRRPPPPSAPWAALGLAVLLAAGLAVTVGAPGGAPPPRAAAAAGEASVLGVLGAPRLDEDPSLAGTDADGNGVRDDIDRIIAASPLSRLHRVAATRLAMALQGVMEAPPMDAEAAHARGRQLLDAVVCLASLGAPIRSLGRELEAYTFNTPERRAMALATRRNLETSGLTEGGEWHCL